MNALTKIRAAKSGLAIALLTASVAVQAALPASVGTSITAIETDGKAIFDLVFPVVAALLGLAVVIKLFKRFTNKV